ncbi:alanyl-tRNA editing protein [Agromyces cerinus]|uniref:Alanyl-tRNA synthetase n=1 Tax=Agromyces cerinus subsp. cerinus TaxID=232089 RepID=A0A1N6I0A9_9MICO|nr:metal-dependent hydrolase [Agromyces cerinus]SIO25472.1 alanyl-tRNA synthetase [Agromyces cerinus subsp. cerinus]
MTLPSRDTIVTYPGGALEAESIVLHIAPAGDGLVAVVTETTSFHPVDAAWPDQPADTGSLSTGGPEIPIVDAVVAATDGTELFLGSDIPVRKGSEGWSFLVAHLVADGAAIAEGDTATVRADASARRALSVGHTACHAAALALNAALAGNWSKAAREDALGAPDFDGIAIASSRIVPGGSVDVYRLNKSLRRAGFDTAAVAADELGELAASVTATIAEWAAAGAPVRIDREGDGLTDRRYWVAELPVGTASIACGGTHVESLAELGDVRVEFEAGDDAGTPVLTMRTHAEPPR